MGKAKPRHKNNRVHNKTQPTGLPSVKDVDSEEAELGESGKDEYSILTIIDEVQSSNVEERISGLSSLADLAEKSELVEIIIKHKVLKIIAPLLVDKNSEVRNLAAGVLRNLSATGSVDICERLVKEDIMTPLLSLLQQYNDWKPESNTENTDTLLQVVNILWNVCETNETALKYFNSANVLNVLLRCLDYKTVGLDLSITVCHCLNSVSEDNLAVLSVLRSYETDLLTMLFLNNNNNRLLLLKTLAAGIVVNLNPSTPWLVPVLGVIAEALQRDIRNVVNQLSSELPLNSDSPASTEVIKSLEDAETLIQAQTMALEILANLTSSQDDEMDADSEGSASEDEDPVNGWRESDDTQLLVLSPEIYEGLEKYKLVAAVLNKIESLPENVMNIISCCPASKNLTKRFVKLQCRAFLCFNNLVAVVDLKELQGPHCLYTLVKHSLAQRLCESHSEYDPNNEMLEAVTAAVRAILLRLASIKFTDLGEVTSTDLEMIFNIGAASPEPRIQANVIRIVGTLGMLLNNNPLVVKMAGNYLLQSTEKQLILWLVAEALDALLDVFSEDCTDQSAAEINLVPRLQALAPRLKSKVRQERKTLGEHYPLVSTVMSNLAPFIKYKGARVSNVSTHQ